MSGGGDRLNLSARPDWQNEAACRGYPLAWFFPSIGMVPPPEAYALCKSCPVTEECAREGARDVGLWAGNYRSEKKSRQYRPEVRCARCRRLFTRSPGSVDWTCDSCLAPVELARRRARDAKRRYRAQRAELEREVDGFVAGVVACEREWEQVESEATSGARGRLRDPDPVPDTCERGIEMAHISEAQ